MQDNLILTNISESRFVQIVRDILNEQQSVKLPSVPDDEILTEKQVRAILHVSKVTLAKWRKEGRIPYTRIGTRIRYNKRQLLDSLQSTKYGRTGR